MSDNVISGISLCFWSLDKDGKNEPPTIAATRQSLSANNLITERAADIPETTAFRRACSAIKGDDIIVRHFVRKSDDVHCCQFDREIQDEGRLRRQYIGTYGIVEGVPVLQSGDGIDGMEEAFATATATYTWADCSKVVQEILKNDGMGAYSPKKNGGVYFVPVKPEAADLLERIERFASSLGVRFLRYSIPDTTAQREEIADAVAASFMEEIGIHSAAIMTYSEDTRVGILSNRREMIAATDASMERLRSIMNGRFQDCRNRMRELLVGIAAIETRIKEKDQRQQMKEAAKVQEQQQMDSLEGGRRIAGVA